mmetsp:Transcript_17103/g.43824  ORF Transcript_17103/g.43824 Transcript_17103/m.43824 type:complete len:322 (+) Transcript_17103:239-1204(+)
MGVSLAAPLGLTDEELRTAGVSEAAERLSLALYHKMQLQLRGLNKQLRAAQGQNEELNTRLADVRRRAGESAAAATRANAKLAEVSAALVREQNDGAQLRKRAGELDVRIANDDARQRELEKRVKDFLEDAGELVDSTDVLKESMRANFYDRRREMEQRTVQTIARYTGKLPSDPDFPLIAINQRALSLRPRTASEASGAPRSHRSPSAAASEPSAIGIQLLSLEDQERSTPGPRRSSMKPRRSSDGLGGAGGAGSKPPPFRDSTAVYNRVADAIAHGGRRRVSIAVMSGTGSSSAGSRGSSHRASSSRPVSANASLGPFK